jgi:hypothetical protein
MPMICHLIGMNDPVKGHSDWKSIQTRFVFQEGQNPRKITLNLVINGRGTVWIDDVVLSSPQCCINVQF